MKAKDLISVLEDLNPETDVYFKPQNSSYPEDFTGYVRENITIRAFWGPDFKGAILTSDGQVGGV